MYQILSDGQIKQLMWLQLFSSDSIIQHFNLSQPPAFSSSHFLWPHDILTCKSIRSKTIKRGMPPTMEVISSGKNTHKIRHQKIGNRLGTIKQKTLRAAWSGNLGTTKWQWSGRERGRGFSRRPLLCPLSQLEKCDCDPATHYGLQLDCTPQLKS